MQLKQRGSASCGRRGMRSASWTSLHSLPCAVRRRRCPGGARVPPDGGTDDGSRVLTLPRERGLSGGTRRLHRTGAAAHRHPHSHCGSGGSGSIRGGRGAMRDVRLDVAGCWIGGAGMWQRRIWTRHRARDWLDGPRRCASPHRRTPCVSLRERSGSPVPARAGGDDAEGARSAAHTRSPGEEAWRGAAACGAWRVAGDRFSEARWVAGLATRFGLRECSPTPAATA